jgi:hypothetical protein
MYFEVGMAGGIPTERNILQKEKMSVKFAKKFLLAFRQYLLLYVRSKEVQDRIYFQNI